MLHNNMWDKLVPVILLAAFFLSLNINKTKNK